MSAIFGIRTPNVIHLLTDGVATWHKDGTVAFIRSKQAVTRNGIAVAGIGLWATPGPRFAQLLDERTKNFDEAIAAAPGLWREARTLLSPASLKIPFTTLLAGWSDERERLEMHALASRTVDGIPDMTDPTAVEASGPVAVYAGGPTESGGDFLSGITKAFWLVPAAFDPRRDGIAFMQHVRRHCPKKCGDNQWRPCVGGHVELTTLTRESIKTEIIHTWPDRVGHHIEIPKATTGSADTTERHAQAQQAA